MAWYNASWDYRVKVTIDNTQVGSTLTNFPVYVDLADLPADFHTNVKSDGGDIRVTSSDETTELARELVFYDSTNDEGELWVNVSSVSSSADTDIYIYYGNSGASDYATNATYGAENTWNSNYIGVYHLYNGTSTDSTSNGNDLTQNGTPSSTTGKVYDGMDFTLSDYLSNTSLTGGTELDGSWTTQAWYNPDNATSNQNQIVLWAGTTALAQMASRTTTHGYYKYGGTDMATTTKPSDSTWTMVHITSSGGNSHELFYNGSSAATGTTASQTGTVTRLYVGEFGTAQERYDGQLDEMRYVGAVLSDDWIAAEYVNQNSTTTFYTAGSQESQGATASLEQEGFRFRNDNGSETTATWLAAQDTNAIIALDTNFRLRTLINGTNDPSSTAFTLRYQKNGTGGYTAVPTNSGSTIQPVIEAADVTESGNNTASASWDVTTPALATGDLIIMNIGWDDSTTVTSISPANGPNGETWTQIDTYAASASTEVRMASFYTVATGSWSAGSVTVTPSASEQWTAAVIKVPAGEFDSTTPIGAADTAESAATNESSVNSPALTLGSSDGGGTIVFCGVVDADPQSSLTSGWTSVANTDRGALSLSANVRDTVAVNSESLSAGAASTTITSDSWASIMYVVRPAVTTNEIYVATSSNITAGGEATTAQLTAPSGKTTSNFTIGRMWDDENGSDSIDIADGFYTELEWNMLIQDPGADTDYYEFRVYAGGSVLDTYTVTPKITVGSGGETAAVTAVSIVASVPSTTATYDEVDSAVVANVGLTLSVQSVTATYNQIETAAVDAISIVASVQDVTATSSSVATASVAVVDTTLSVQSVTATYEGVWNASVAAVDTTLSVPATTATSQGALSADVAEVGLTLSVQTVTATYEGVYNAGVSEVTATLSVQTVTATYAGVFNASVAAISVVANVQTVTASYDEVDSATVDVVTSALSVPNTTATYDAVTSASVAVIDTTLSVQTVTATSSSGTVAGVDVVTSTLSVQTVTATYQGVWNAGVAVISVVASVQTTTATYNEVDTAAVDVITTTLSVPTTTAAYSSGTVAGVDVIDTTLSVQSVTATYAGVYSASVSAISVVLSAQATTATYNAVISATVAVIDTTLSVQAVTATSSSGTVANVDVVNLTASIQAVTATYEGVWNATVTEITNTLSIPATTATYDEIDSAGVAAVDVTLTPQAVTATYDEVYDATVAVLSMIASVVEPTATHQSTAIVDAVGMTLNIQSVTAESNIFVPRKYYTDSNGNVYWVISESVGLVEKV